MHGVAVRVDVDVPVVVVVGVMDTDAEGGCEGAVALAEGVGVQEDNDPATAVCVAVDVPVDVGSGVGTLEEGEIDAIEEEEGAGVVDTDSVLTNQSRRFAGLPRAVEVSTACDSPRTVSINPTNVITLNRMVRA